MPTAALTEPVSLHPERWDLVTQLVDHWCDSGEVPSAALLVGSSNETSGPYLFGRQRLDEDRPLRDDAIFLIASITKPVVATGVLLLVERGYFTLEDKVSDLVPGFGRNGKYGVTVRHLLTHTSGLPDMLPENVDLRAANAPLAEFVEKTCAIELGFAPGRAVQYQSMGFAVLGEIIRQVTGTPCNEFLREEIFRPLHMHDTELGAPEAWFQTDAADRTVPAGEPEGPPSASGADRSEDSGRKVDRIAEIRLPAAQREAEGWNWNSRYWRTLGAPWGGLLTTAADLGRFAQMMLNGGILGERRLLGDATVAAATRNQLEPMRDVPEADRRCRPWGLGWRLNWPAHSANFGDFLGPGTYGHWGATGTVLWISPELDIFTVILTTQPQEPNGSYLARLSNAVAAAIVLDQA